MMPRTEASSCSNHEEKWSGSDKDNIPGFDGYGQAAESRTEAKMHGTEIGNVHFSFGCALTGTRPRADGNESGHFLVKKYFAYWILSPIVVYYSSG
jgi:hypothetical protein